VKSALILALNPSIDAEWRVDDVIWEEKNNVQSERRWAGGKGINVARWLKRIGGSPELLLPLGGDTGDELAGYLRAEEITSRIIPLNEATRVNVIVTTRLGRQMRFNPPGPELSNPQWNAVLMTVKKKLVRMSQVKGRVHGVSSPTSLLVLSGSLPRGVPVKAYADLIRLARKHGVKTLLDCDGAAFREAIQARPFLVKPNEHELACWWKMPLRNEKEIVRAARALSEETRGWVFVSRGADASILLNVKEDFQASEKPAAVKPRNTVGAGDALLAGAAWRIQLGATPRDWLACGLAVGTYATECLAGQVNREGASAGPRLQKQAVSCTKARRRRNDL